MATTVLLRLGALSGDDRYRSGAERALGTVAPYLARYPTGFAQWLCALELAHGGIDEVAIVASSDDDDAARRLLAVANRAFAPFRVVASTVDGATSRVPLLRDRVAVGGRATAYVCRDFACRMPVEAPEELEALLQRG